jgi:hypothetical protein
MASQGGQQGQRLLSGLYITGKLSGRRMGMDMVNVYFTPRHSPVVMYSNSGNLKKWFRAASL